MELDRLGIDCDKHAVEYCCLRDGVDAGQFIADGLARLRAERAAPDFPPADPERWSVWTQSRSGVWRRVFTGGRHQCERRHRDLLADGCSESALLLPPANAAGGGA
jgi:hypothetical protein